MTVPIAPKTGPSYSTWSESAKGEVDIAEFNTAMSSFNKAIGESRPVLRSEASYNGYSYRDLAPNTSGRTPFTRQNYEYFRPNEIIPTRYKDILDFCLNVYKRVSIVHQIIDLMGDFATKGIRLVHQNPEIQRYHEAWWNKVRGKHTSERIVNNLLKLGTIHIRQHTCKLTDSQQKQLYRAAAEPDMDYVDIPKNILGKNEIPLKYTLYSPLCIEDISGPLGALIGKPKLSFNIPAELVTKIMKPSADDRDMIKQLPEDVINAAKQGGKVILPQDKMTTLYYKKDDWESFAYPMIYPILDDVITLDKLKLADKTALDGVISKIRVWKLGSLDHKIVPGPDAIAKFSEFLMNNVGGGTMDIVWGPAVELLETNSNTADVLGEEKYVPVLNSIYAGLGVPPSLTGTATPGGLSSNATSLKTLIERLQYVRDVLLEFWNNQLKMLQQAKGFRFPAEIQFDKTVLTDEASEKALLIQLIDRNVISYESVRERFGEIPELESRRVLREMRQREKGLMPEQGDPYHNADTDSDMKKIVLQNGTATPSEVGLELNEKKEGEMTLLEQQTKMQVKIAKATPKPTIPGAPKKKSPLTTKKPKGRSGQGRPKAKKDTKKRKTRTPKPIRGVANILTWAMTAQKQISDILTPALLNTYKKKNARMLTEAEAKECENIKFRVLAQFRPNEIIDKETVTEYLEGQMDSNLLRIWDKSYKGFISSNDKEPTFEELRSLQAASYAIWCINNIEAE